MGTFAGWHSPLTAEVAAAGATRLQDVVVDNDVVYFIEARPQEGGRCVILRCDPQGVTEVLPAPFSARSRVHEYGGAAFTVASDTIYFVNDDDQCIYHFSYGAIPTRLTAPGTRFADLHVTPFGIVAIAERHSDQGVANFIASIHLETGAVTPLVEGRDFYTQLAFSRDFSQMAYVCYDHPNMPWDSTELWVHQLANGAVQSAQQIDAEYTDQSFFQPRFGPANELVVASDKTDFWNLYRVIGNQIAPLFTVSSEIGAPLWDLGESCWDFFADGVVCTFHQDGKAKLFLFNNTLQEIPTNANGYSRIQAGSKGVAMVATFEDQAPCIGYFSNNRFEIVYQTPAPLLDRGYISQPQAITFDSHGRKAYGYFYAPRNKDVAPSSDLPPLIVKCHGGPTTATGPDFSLDIQYWTSRGFAVVDVNYAGSSGYGRKYRKSLYGNWGVFDAEDCEAAALYLAQHNLVDPNRLCIMGGSAGGLTVLNALAMTKTFHAGSSLYGVADLLSLASDTHKFEAHYLDHLVGQLPETKARYTDRSPLHHAHLIKAPLIFFQGSEDKVVPPRQSEAMHDAVKKNGIKTEYFLFEGEQHGFRKAHNRAVVLKEQLRFFLEAFSG